MHGPSGLCHESGDAFDQYVDVVCLVHYPKSKHFGRREHLPQFLQPHRFRPQEIFALATRRRAGALATAA